MTKLYVVGLGPRQSKYDHKCYGAINHSQHVIVDTGFMWI